MEVLLAEEYGFCFGVERAVDMVEEAVEEGARPIRSLGPLIHNAQEMERLGARGVSTIDSPDQVDANEIAVIRAHGVRTERRETQTFSCLREKVSARRRRMLMFHGDLRSIPINFLLREGSRR